MDRQERKKTQKTQKEPKRRPKYGMFSCVAYIYRILWRFERGLVFTVIFTIPISLALSALALYTPPAVLQALTQSRSPGIAALAKQEQFTLVEQSLPKKYNLPAQSLPEKHKLSAQPQPERFTLAAQVILGLLLAQLLLNLVNNVIAARIHSAENRVLAHLGHIWTKYVRERDWYHDYNPEARKAEERAQQGTQNNHGAGVHFPMDFANMLTQALKFLLFGAVVSLLHPAILLLLALGCALNAYMGKWERRKNWEDRDIRNDLEKKINYTTTYVSQNFHFAKDVRLYNMKPFLRERLVSLFARSAEESRKREYRSVLTAAVSYLVVLIRDGAAYLFLIHEALEGKVDASSFVLYFSAITSLSGVMNNILGMMSRVSEGAMQLSDFREAMEFQDRLNRGPGIPLPPGPFSIEFKEVSYKYPEGDKQVLDHISFRIEAGEKIALVGLNGAGKTTLVRLMCGLLLPDQGEILLDGHSLYEYNRDEMYSLFGIVPQGFNLLPATLAQNIACTMAEEEMDRDRLNACIRQAGLWEKIASLPRGADTPLGRELDREGTELSGGETQKLLLARLLYKNPPCIILDEPTAALDPIAEDRMYRIYNEIAAGATSVFISHRLASTCFCDRIFLLEGAGIAEAGTHGELMAAGGKYRELYELQSRYYREGAQGHGRA
ncbi:MAG: ABC transporter ATP-binding protein [Lachnospiraceae bacterium]|nr:ABC transporter ATP-binding protein [Lachnospiraceae bacterium]